jgi:cobaltochelatase CobS
MTTTKEAGTQFIRVLPDSMLCEPCVINAMTANEKRTEARRVLNAYNKRQLDNGNENSVIATLWIAGAKSAIYERLLIHGEIPQEHAPSSFAVTSGASASASGASASGASASTKETPVPTVPTTDTADSGNAPDLSTLRDILDILAREVERRTKGSVDAEQVADIARHVYAEMNVPRTVTIENLETGHTQDIGHAHFLFDLVLRVCQCRLSPMLVGPSGSGKTHLAKQVAEALELPFFCISVCETTSEFQFLGYMDAHGAYVRTPFRDAYEHGGVFCLDEIDGGGASLIVLNSALAGQFCMFPDGMVKRHADFVLIATANTYGLGADREYVGRQQLDAATLNRLFMIEFPYDHCLEAAMIGASADGDAQTIDLERGGLPTVDAWLKRVRKLRAAAEALRERIVISPRATRDGCKLLAAGIGRYWIEHGLIWQGRDQSVIDKITKAA